MIIDLGEVSSAWSPDVMASPRRPISRHVSQTVTLCVVALATLVGSALPPPPPMRLVASIPAKTAALLLVHGQRAIVIDGPDGRSEIRSYSLVDGARQWTAPFVGDRSSTYLTASSTTVVATTEDADTDTGTASTVAYDLRTGRERWHQPGFAREVLDDGGVVILVAAEAPDGTRVGEAATKVVELSTGTTRWQESLGDDCQFAVSGTTVDPPSSVVDLCQSSGVMTVRDLATGRIRARRAVRSPATPGGPPEQVTLDAFGDLTIVEDFGYLGTVVNAYRTGDTTLLWSHHTWPDVYYFACGEHLCQTGDAPTSGAVMDPQTGAVIPGLAIPVSPSDPPVVFGTTGGKSTMLELLPDFDSPRIPVPGVFATYAAPVPTDVSIDMPDARGGSTWVVRQQGTTLTTIQKLTGVRADSCVAIAGYVACSMPSHHLALWRLP